MSPLLLVRPKNVAAGLHTDLPQRDEAATRADRWRRDEAADAGGGDSDGADDGEGVGVNLP